MTGLYPHVHGIEGLAHRGWEYKPEVRTLPQILKKGKYRSYLIGYQHETSKIERLGYDECIMPEHKSAPLDEVVPLLKDFFAVHAKDRQAWFISVGCSEVHSPYDSYVPEDESNIEVPKYIPDCPESRQDLAGFYGAIRHMDKRVGDILDLLDKNDLSKNTIVIFTTDHGPAWPRAKISNYEPGMRCALIVRHPEAVPGQVVENMTSHVDIAPTILEWMGEENPVKMNGISFAESVRGEMRKSQEYVFAEDIATRTIRTEKFKYMLNFKDDLPVGVPMWLKTRQYAVDLAKAWSPLPKERLYDLEKDPLEQKNLAYEKEYGDIKESLRNRLFKCLEDTNDRILTGFIPERVVTR